MEVDTDTSKKDSEDRETEDNQTSSQSKEKSLYFSLLRFSNSVSDSDNLNTTQSCNSQTDQLKSDFTADGETDDLFGHSGSKETQSYDDLKNRETRESRNLRESCSNDSEDYQNENQSRRKYRDRGAKRSRGNQRRNFRDSRDNESYDRDSHMSREDRGSKYNSHSRKSRFDKSRNSDNSRFDQRRSSFEANGQNRFGFGNSNPNGPGMRLNNPHNFQDYEFNPEENDFEQNNCFNPNRQGPLLINPPFCPPNGPPQCPPMNNSFTHPFDNNSYGPPQGPQMNCQNPQFGPPNNFFFPPNNSFCPPNSNFGPPNLNLPMLPPNCPPHQNMNNPNFGPPQGFQTGPPNPHLMQQPPCPFPQQMPPNFQGNNPENLHQNLMPQNQAMPVPAPIQALTLLPPPLPPQETPPQNSTSPRKGKKKSKKGDSDSLLGSLPKENTSFLPWDIPPPSLPLKSDIPLPPTPLSIANKKESSALLDDPLPLPSGIDRDSEETDSLLAKATEDLDVLKDTLTVEDDDSITEPEAFKSTKNLEPLPATEDYEVEPSSLMVSSGTQPLSNVNERIGKDVYNDSTIERDFSVQKDLSTDMEVDDKFPSYPEPTLDFPSSQSSEYQRFSILKDTEGKDSLQLSLKSQDQSKTLSMHDTLTLSSMLTPEKKIESGDNLDDSNVAPNSSGRSPGKRIPCLSKEEAKKRLRSFSTNKALCKDKNEKGIPLKEAKPNSQKDDGKKSLHKKKKDKDKVSVMEEIRDYEMRFRETLRPLPSLDRILGNPKAMKLLESKGANLKEFVKRREEILASQEEEPNIELPRMPKPKQSKECNALTSDASKGKESVGNFGRDKYKSSEGKKEKEEKYLSSSSSRSERRSLPSSSKTREDRKTKDKFKDIKTIPQSWTDLKPFNLSKDYIKDIINEAYKQEYRYGSSKRDRDKSTKSGENSYFGLYCCKPLEPMTVRGIDLDRKIKYPGSYIKYTHTQPSICYSRNSKHFPQLYCRNEMKQKLKSGPRILLDLMDEVWSLNSKPNYGDEHDTMEQKWYPWNWISSSGDVWVTKGERKPENALDLLSSSYDTTNQPLESVKKDLSDINETEIKDFEEIDANKQKIKVEDTSAEMTLTDDKFSNSKPFSHNDSLACNENQLPPKEFHSKSPSKVVKLKQEVKLLVSTIGEGPNETSPKILKLKQKEVKSLLVSVKDKPDKKILKMLKKKLKREIEKRKVAKREAKKLRAKALKAEKKKKKKMAKNKKKVNDSLGLSEEFDNSFEAVENPEKSKAKRNNQSDAAENVVPVPEQSTIMSVIPDSKLEQSTSEASKFYDPTSLSLITTEDKSKSDKVFTKQIPDTGSIDKYSPSNLSLYSDDSDTEVANITLPVQQPPSTSPPSSPYSPLTSPILSSLTDARKTSGECPMTSFSPYSPSSPQVSPSGSLEMDIENYSDVNSFFTNNSADVSIMPSNLKEGKLLSSSSSVLDNQYLREICPTENIPMPVPPVPSNLQASIASLSHSNLKFGIGERATDSPLFDDGASNSPDSLLKKESKPVMFRLSGSKQSTGMQPLKKKVASAFVFEEEYERSSSPLSEELTKDKLSLTKTEKNRDETSSELKRKEEKPSESSKKSSSDYFSPKDKKKCNSSGTDGLKKDDNMLSDSNHSVQEKDYSNEDSKKKHADFPSRSHSPENKDGKAQKNKSYSPMKDHSNKYSTDKSNLSESASNDFSKQHKSYSKPPYSQRRSKSPMPSKRRSPYRSDHSSKRSRSPGSNSRGSYHSKRQDESPYHTSSYSSRYSRSPPPYRSRHSRSPDRRDRSPVRKRSKSPHRRYSPHSRSRSRSPYDKWRHVRSPPPKYRKESSRYYDSHRRLSRSPMKDDAYWSRKSPPPTHKDYSNSKTDPSYLNEDSSKYINSANENLDSYQYDDKSYSSPGNSPRHLSLDERLKQEHGLDLGGDDQKDSYDPEKDYWDNSQSQSGQDYQKVIRVGNVLQVLPMDSTSPEKVPQTEHHPDYFPTQRSVQSANIIQIPVGSNSFPTQDVSSSPASMTQTSPSTPLRGVPLSLTSTSPLTPSASSNLVITPVPSPVPPPTTRVRIVIPKSAPSYTRASSPPKTTVSSSSSPSFGVPLLESPVKGSFLENLDADEALPIHEQESLVAADPLSLSSHQQQQAIISAAAVAAAAAATAGVSPSTNPIAQLISVLQQQNLLSAQSFGQPLTSVPEPIAQSPTVEQTNITTSVSQDSSEKEDEITHNLMLYREAKLERRLKKKQAKKAKKEAKRIEFEKKLAREKEIESLNNSMDSMEDDEAIIKEAISEVPDLGSPIPDYELYNDDLDEEEEEEEEPKPPIKILPPPDKSILICPSSRYLGNYVQKSVSFADGVMPGEATSPSGGEEIHSPPPPTASLKKKEKKLRKKKAVKIKIIKEFVMDDGISSPPPPPAITPPQEALKLYPGCTHCTFTSPATVVLYTQQQHTDANKLTLVDLPNGNTVTIPPGMLMHSTALVK